MSLSFGNLFSGHQLFRLSFVCKFHFSSITSFLSASFVPFVIASLLSFAYTPPEASLCKTLKMRIKFLATWGLLLSSAVGSPMPRPEPKPEPKPVPMPVPGGAMSTQDDPLNNAHKIAIAALVAGTCLTVVTTLYNEYLAKYASRVWLDDLKRERTKWNTMILDFVFVLIFSSCSPGRGI